MKRFFILCQCSIELVVDDAFFSFCKFSVSQTLVCSVFIFPRQKSSTEVTRQPAERAIRAIDRPSEREIERKIRSATLDDGDT